MSQDARDILLVIILMFSVVNYIGLVTINTRVMALAKGKARE